MEGRAYCRHHSFLSISVHQLRDVYNAVSPHHLLCMMHPMPHTMCIVSGNLGLHQFSPPWQILSPGVQVRCWALWAYPKGVVHWCWNVRWNRLHCSSVVVSSLVQEDQYMGCRGLTSLPYKHSGHQEHGVRMLRLWHTTAHVARHSSWRWHNTWSWCTR